MLSIISSPKILSIARPNQLMATHKRIIIIKEPNLGVRAASTALGSLQGEGTAAPI